MITLASALNRLIDGNELFYDEMVDLMRQVMQGEISEPALAALLMGLRTKVESVSEISAAASVMREFATHVPVKSTQGLVDTCGTGGDGTHTFNISTCAAFVSAGAGVKIAKHGGRSVSSSSGSADVLELMGVNLNLSAEQVGTCIDEVGIGFMFAPNHHSAMRYVAPVRKALGVRTIFNILGPLTNPAGAPNQVMGVFHPDLVGIQARVLKQLGARHALIVHGKDGIDEISLSQKTYVAELKDNKIFEYELDPLDFGFKWSDRSELYAQNAAESKQHIMKVLTGELGAARNITLMNAAAAIYVSGKAKNFEEGLKMAEQSINKGLALQKLEQLIAKTNSFSDLSSK